MVFFSDNCFQMKMKKKIANDKRKSVVREIVMIFRLIVLSVIFLVNTAAAEFTIHILNPWNSDSVADRRENLRMVGNAEVGYHPGTDMQNEGGGWFYYIYKSSAITRTSKTNFTVCTWIGSQTWQGRVTYGHSIRMDSVFAKVATDVEEVWLVLSDDTNEFPSVYATPPQSKVINILNPWPENSPKIIIDKQPAVQMRMRKDLCGWYRYYYAGPLDSLANISFTDFFLEGRYNLSGLNSDGPGLDLRDMMRNSDTIYILPRPFPYGEPSLTNEFPGRLGDCNTRKVSGICRDWQLDNVSFFNTPIGLTTGEAGMVMGTLTAPDYKPRLTDDPDADITNSSKLESWFKTVTFENGQNNDTCVDLTMIKSYDGRWTLDSDLMGGFFPIDDFDNPNNIKYFDRLQADDPTGKYHNFHFTMEMHLQFVYHEGKNLEFAFRGDDDVWIFVNNRLAIDLGGVHDRAKDTLWLDKDKELLGLEDGKTYNMDIFFAERNPVGSNLLIQTTMDLRNSSELYYRDKRNSDDGSVVYDIWQQVKTEENDCGLTMITNGEELASVDFYIDGPSFSKTEQLTEGTHYGGIIVKSASQVLIDSADISGLLPGEYRVTFISKSSRERSGFLTFYVPQIADHLDMLTDTTFLNPVTDAVIDELYMDERTDSLVLTAIIRDKFGSFMEKGYGLEWKCSDEAVLTVKADSVDLSRAVVRKNGKGSVWITVSKDGLRPDSVLVKSAAKPDWPFIKKAVMTDSKGNCIPDLIKITLSDTIAAGVSLNSVKLTYKNTDFTVSGEDCEISGKNISVPFANNTGTDCRPHGKVTIVLGMGETGSESSSSDFTDGVGPALLFAEILENESDDPDLLFLTFSEPVDELTISGKQYQLIADGTNDTSDFSILRISDRTNDSMFTVVAVQNSKLPHVNDSLRLLPGNRNGIIEDMIANTAHELNRAVPVRLRKGAPGIINAYYKDADADGMVDNVVICFKRSVELNEFENVTAEINMTKITVNSDEFTKKGDSAISVPLKSNFGTKDNLLTSGAMYLAVKYSSLGITHNREAADSAAPVIASVKLTRGGYNDDGTQIYDTLCVVYSEVVKNVSSTVFPLVSKKREFYEMEASEIRGEGAQVVYVVKNITPGEIIPLKTDSIWISADGGISDKSGALQTNEQNRRVQLDVVQPKTVWTIKTGPNPATEKDLLRDGICILAVSKRNVDMKFYSAEIKIFDGLGNNLVDARLVPDNKTLLYKWNGRNNKGRRVGCGTYMAVITIFENSETIYRQSCPLGIRR